MGTKHKVKVIKKGETRTQPKPVVSEVKTKRAAAREVVANVSGWVSDFQARKREETKLAFEQLFAVNARPSET
ncbi:MAG: hypothetical protein KIT61_16385 [Pyrinomonadaceae bacterium]|nr:hypothetical protein [Pyrinomonadaceae bacterium]